MDRAITLFRIRRPPYTLTTVHHQHVATHGNSAPHWDKEHTSGITLEIVEGEIQRLRSSWKSPQPPCPEDLLSDLLSPSALTQIDRFDLVQLAEVVRLCRRTQSLSDAGRLLFAASRAKKTTPNDADRLRKYLNRFNIDWRQIRAAD